MDKRLEKITTEILNRAITIHNLGNQASDKINKGFNIPDLLEVLNEYNITKIGFDSFHKTFVVEFISGMKVLIEIPVIKAGPNLFKVVGDFWDINPDEVADDIDLFIWKMINNGLKAIDWEAMKEIGNNE